MQRLTRTVAPGEGVPDGLRVDEAGRLGRDPSFGVPCLLAQTERVASYPTAPGSFYACSPLTVLGPEVEGGPGARFCIDNDAGAGAGEGAAPGAPRAAGPGAGGPPMSGPPMTGPPMTGPPTTGPDGSRGLGTHLIRAFAAQLGGPAEIEAEGGTYRVCVAFPLHAAPAEGPSPAGP